MDLIAADQGGDGGGWGLRRNGGQSKVLVGAQEESQGRGGGARWPRRGRVKTAGAGTQAGMAGHEQRGAGLLGRVGRGVCWGGAAGADRLVRGHGHRCGREGYGGSRPESVLRPPAEKRSLLVKELQSLTVAQRGHMLKGMPLGLAEKRSLRSVPIGPGRPPPPASLAGLGGR